jgi:hypothetical protein
VVPPPPPRPPFPPDLTVSVRQGNRGL